eukprot:360197-Chlamydomonas_euryale.AAC.6
MGTAAGSVQGCNLKGTLRTRNAPRAGQKSTMPGAGQRGLCQGQDRRAPCQGQGKGDCAKGRTEGHHARGRTGYSAGSRSKARPASMPHHRAPQTAQAKDGPFGPFESKTISLALHKMEVEADGNMVVASERGGRTEGAVGEVVRRVRLGRSYGGCGWGGHTEGAARRSKGGCSGAARRRVRLRGVEGGDAGAAMSEWLGVWREGAVGVCRGRCGWGV